MPEILELGDIKERASIYRKAKTEGWVKGRNATLVQKKVQAKQSLAQADAEIATKSDTERDVINEAVAESLQIQKFFRGAHMLVANTVAKKVSKDGQNATYQELASAAIALGRTQESVLGKAPETVINNQNVAQAGVVMPSPAEVRRINQMLEVEC